MTEVGSVARQFKEMDVDRPVTGRDGKQHPVNEAVCKLFRGYKQQNATTDMAAHASYRL